MTARRWWRWPAYLVVGLLLLTLLAWWVRDVPAEPDGDPDGGAIGFVVFVAEALVALGALALVVLVLERTVFRDAPASLATGPRRWLVAGGVGAVVLVLGMGSSYTVPFTWLTLLLVLAGVAMMLPATARANATGWVAGVVSGTALGWYLAVLESIASGDWPR